MDLIPRINMNACVTLAIIMFQLMLAASCFCQKRIGDQHLMGILVLPGDTTHSSISSEEYLLISEAVGSALEDKGFLIKDLSMLIQQSDLKYHLPGHLSYDHFTLLAENALEDIIVKVKVAVQQIGDDITIGIHLLASDGYTSEIYARSGWLWSTRRRWPGLYLPTMEALRLNKGFDSFVAELEGNMQRVVKKGRLFDIQVTSENVNLMTSKEIQPLNRTIIDWAKENSGSGRFRTIATNKHILRLEAYLPPFDPNGQPSTPLDWGLRLKNMIEYQLSKMPMSKTYVELNILKGLLIIEIV